MQTETANGIPLTEREAMILDASKKLGTTEATPIAHKLTFRRETVRVAIRRLQSFGLIPESRP